MNYGELIWYFITAAVILIVAVVTLSFFWEPALYALAYLAWLILAPAAVISVLILCDWVSAKRKKRRRAEKVAGRLTGTNSSAA